MGSDKDTGKEFLFSVNGEELVSQFQKLVAIDVLKIAKDKDAIPNKPEDYWLKGNTQVYKLDDWIDLSEDKTLISIPHGPTPVA